MAIGETGKLSTNISGRDDLIRVEFTEAIDTPIICLSSTGRGPDAYNIRIETVDETGFTFSMEEASYHDGKHMQEEFHWMAVSKGTHTLPDGRTIVAGQSDTDSDGTDIRFDTSFAKPPVVLTSVMSNNAVGMVDSDPTAVTTDGFRLSLEGQDNVGNAHGAENLGYIAIAQGGDGTAGTAAVHADLTSAHTFFDLGASYDDPVILGETQSANDGDHAHVLLRTTESDRAELFLREEKSSDKELTHGSEDLGLVAFEPGLILSYGEVHGVVPCFTRDSRIETPKGLRPVRDLRQGDLVQTMDRGLQQVLWISRTRVPRDMLLANPNYCPVRVRRGALGNGLPLRELVLSPQHRVVISDPSLRARFGSDRVLVPIKALINGDTVEQLPANRGWTYFHLLLPHHCLILAEGCLTESLSAEAASQMDIPEAFRTLPMWNSAPPLPTLTTQEARQAWTAIRSRPRRHVAQTPRFGSTGAEKVSIHSAP